MSEYGDNFPVGANEDQWGHGFRASQNYRIKKTLNISGLKFESDRKKLFDLACGFGHIKKYINHRNELYLFDISETAVNYVKKNNIGYGDVNILPEVPSNLAEADYIFCLEVLCYLSQNEVKIFLQNVKERLRAGTILMISVPMESEASSYIVNMLMNLDFKNLSVDYTYSRIFLRMESYLMTPWVISYRIKNKIYKNHKYDNFIKPLNAIGFFKVTESIFRFILGQSILLYLTFLLIPFKKESLKSNLIIKLKI